MSGTAGTKQCHVVSLNTHSPWKVTSPFEQAGAGLKERSGGASYSETGVSNDQVSVRSFDVRDPNDLFFPNVLSLYNRPCTNALSI